jgi:hypothetical protein
MSRVVRAVTLVGTLEGPIWWPAVTAQKSVQADLIHIAAGYVNATGSGLIEAIESVTDDGDFRSARLTGDSFVLIEHRRLRANGWTSRLRAVHVKNLPSLADYVAPDSLALGWEPE